MTATSTAMTAADSLDTVQIGDHTTFEKTVSESDIYTFSGVTGDFAPVHVSERYMQATPYGRRIAQGVLVLGYATAASSAFGPSFGFHGVSAGYDRLRFVKPVFIGDTIRVVYEVKAIDRERERLHCEVRITNQDDELVLVAEHLMKAIPFEAPAAATA